MNQDAAEGAADGAAGAGNETSTEGVEKDARGGDDHTSGITAEDVQKMVNEAVQKAVNPGAEKVTAENIQSVVETAVQKAMEPVLKSAGLPTNLNDSNVQKSDGDECYLHGIL